MDSEPRIKLEIPDTEGFDDEYGHAMPVSSEVVAYTIDLLQCFIAQYRLDDGCEPDAAVWDRLAAAAGHALAGLLNAQSAYYHDRDAPALVEQIAFFCRADDAPQRLPPLREPGAVFIPNNGPQAADIIDALLTVWEKNQRRRKEPKQQQAAAEQGPVAERNPGWEF